MLTTKHFSQKYFLDTNNKNTEYNRRADADANTTPKRRHQPPKRRQHQRRRQHHERRQRQKQYQPGRQLIQRAREEYQIRQITAERKAAISPKIIFT